MGVHRVLLVSLMVGWLVGWLDGSLGGWMVTWCIFFSSSLRIEVDPIPGLHEDNLAPHGMRIQTKKTRMRVTMPVDNNTHLGMVSLYAIYKRIKICKREAYGYNRYLRRYVSIFK